MVLKEGVRDSIRKDSLAIIQVVVGYEICVHVESLNSVKGGSCLGAVHYLHNFVHRVEGMAFFIKVFCEAVGLVIVSEGGFVFFVSRVHN